jgi:hypothetical protein
MNINSRTANEYIIMLTEWSKDAVPQRYNAAFGV